MSEHVTSPELDVDKGVVRSPREFAGGLTLDLDEVEIQRAFDRAIQIVQKHQYRRWSTEEQMDKIYSEIEDEVATTFAEIGVLARFDRVGNFIDVMGKLPGGLFDKEGLDHERKEYEVKTANKQGEVFYKDKPKKK